MQTVFPDPFESQSAGRCRSRFRYASVPKWLGRANGPAMTAAGPSPGRPWRTPLSPATSAGRHPEVVEAGDRVGLGPQPDPAGRERIVGRLDREPPVQVAAEPVPLGLHLQLLPLLGRHLRRALLDGAAGAA